MNSHTGLLSVPASGYGHNHFVSSEASQNHPLKVQFSLGNIALCLTAVVHAIAFVYYAGSAIANIHSNIPTQDHTTALLSSMTISNTLQQKGLHHASRGAHVRPTTMAPWWNGPRRLTPLHTSHNYGISKKARSVPPLAAIAAPLPVAAGDGLIAQFPQIVGAAISGFAASTSSAVSNFPWNPMAVLPIVAVTLCVATVLYLTYTRSKLFRDMTKSILMATTLPFRKLWMMVTAKEAAKTILREEGQSLKTKNVDDLSKAIYTTISGGVDTPLGEVLEAGWEKRGANSSIVRNVEVWRFAASCVFKVLQANKAEKKGVAPEEVSAMRVAAAEFIRDGLLELGPTFVKLGQVVSTRGDIFSMDYINVLRTLQDEVPPFSGEKARAIVEAELDTPVEELFQSFSMEPLAAASLGQVHRAVLKDGSQVAIKVQRAGLKELFDVDLKNLKLLAELLDKFDPKSDGADRCWVEIYDESARLLYLEIDYLNEAKNARQFAEQFKNDPGIRVPKVYEKYTTTRVMTMEYVESFKLTNIEKLDSLGLDREKLAKKTAEAFLFQILTTGYFHCDPHPGNLCTNAQGQLVYYDYGMMAQLKPSVLEGFRDFCFALFDGGPFIDDIELGKNAKKMVEAIEHMGVLARGADRLSCEKLARFFIRSFKDIQVGKQMGSVTGILGGDLQAITKEQVFRFPSTFTFIFRAFASIEGIGKELDASYDLTLFAQPFVEKLLKTAKRSDSFEAQIVSLGKLTGLNPADVNTAITSPRKIQYIEETVRAMEQGNLKIRVRALENEFALERLALQQATQNQLLLGSFLMNLGLVATIAELWVPLAVGAYVGGLVCGFKAFIGKAKTDAFDRKQAKYDIKDFNI